MSNPLRVGLIGLGKAGLRHADAIANSENAFVIAAADPGSNARQAAQEHDIAHFSSYQAMLEEVEMDAVIVSLPHDMLADAGMFVARNGKHLLLEKPMAIRTEDAEVLITECRKNGARLMVNFAHRFRVECRQARETIRSGAIGRPVSSIDIMASGASDLPPWVWDRAKSGGGMMMYNGVHSVDRLAWLTGRKITSVSANSGTFSYPVDVEDNLVGTLSFSDGSIGAVVQHKSQARSTLSGWQTIVFGTNGALKVSGETGLEIISNKERNQLLVSEDSHFLGAFNEFEAAIRQERDPNPSGEDGLQALRTVFALYESAESGGQATAVRSV